MSTQTTGNSKVFSVQDVDGVISWGNSPELGVRSVNGIIKWVDLSTIEDLPPETVVIDQYQYDAGEKEGKLGRINANNLDIDKQLRDKLEFIINTYLPTYKALAYLFRIEDNNFKQNKQRYGILTGQKNQNPQINCTEMQTQMQIILVDDYGRTGKNDDPKKEARERLEQAMEELRLRVTNTSAGLFKNGFALQDWSQDEIEFIEDNNNLAVIRATFTLEYQTNLR